MRWMIAVAFLIQPAQSALAVQETNLLPQGAPRRTPASTPVRLPAAASKTVSTGTDPVTDQDLVSFLNEDPEPLTESAPVTEQADSMLWKLVAVLCFVLMFCAFIAIRHGHTKARLTNSGPGQLSLMASLPLANRSVLHLVSAAGSMLVVASDNTGVKSVVRLPEQFDDLVDAAQQPFRGDEVRHA